MKDILKDSINRVEKWVEGNNYLGYEPFDGLTTPMHVLTFGNLFLERLLMQLVRQSPVNLRPLLGIKPLPSTKGRGYMAWGYLSMYKITGDSTYADRVRENLAWLMEHKSPKFEEYSWANHFDFVSRGGRYDKHESIIVWTSSIGQAFLDAYDLFGDEQHLEVARSICNWIMKLPRHETGTGTCIGYLMGGESVVHNSNMLGAAMLARTAAMTGESRFKELAREGMVFSCNRQLPDGAWWYGDHPKYHWIDNFHTGYNLDSLRCYIQYSGDEEFVPNMDSGLEYYRANFFNKDGVPRYYHNRTYPIDIQCASQAITTLSLFAGDYPWCLDLAQKVALWTVNHMQVPNGYFIYRIYPWGRANIPMLHWGQATMYKGLVALLEKISTEEGDY